MYDTETGNDARLTRVESAAGFLHDLIVRAIRVGAMTHARLTSRELQIIRLFLRDLNVIQVAYACGIQIATARVHVRNMHRKTSTRTTHGLVSWAIDHAQCCLADNG